MVKVINPDLGYLGEEFQLKLVKCFVEDKEFFISIEHIVDQNMFTTDPLRRLVGFMRDRYESTEKVASYFDLDTMIRTSVTDVITRENMVAILNKLKNMDLEGMDLVEQATEKFFKQQNLIKAINKATDIVKRGNTDNYSEIEDLFKDALGMNMKKELGHRLFEDVDGDLADDYRETISTGCKELDEALYGGLGKGELGVIISPSGVGKAQPLTSKVLTPTGYKTMGEMKIGDEVIGCDGKSHKVIGVYPQGERPVYKVYFSNDAVCECDENHLWNVKTDKNDTAFVTKAFKDILNEITNNNQHFYIPAAKKIPYTKEIRHILKEVLDTDYHIYKEGDDWFVSVSYEPYITKIQYKGNEHTQCILVDSEEHLYITDDLIVTHNTSATTGFVAAAATQKCESNNFQGYKVLHFYFEDKDKAIHRKYYGNLLDIDACDLSNPEIRPLAVERIKNGVEESEKREMLKANVILQQLKNGATTASDIRRLINTYIAMGFKPDMVVVDYFECLRAERSQTIGESDWTKEAITMRKLESICNEFNVAMWVPVQGTKASIGVEFVGLAQAGGSVAKVQIGHLILSFARTEEQKEQGRMNVFIQKLRAAKIGRTVFRNVKFNNGTCKFDMSDDGGDLPLDEVQIPDSAVQLAKDIAAKSKLSGK